MRDHVPKSKRLGIDGGFFDSRCCTPLMAMRLHVRMNMHLQMQVRSHVLLQSARGLLRLHGATVRNKGRQNVAMQHWRQHCDVGTAL